MISKIIYIIVTALIIEAELSICFVCIEISTFSSANDVLNVLCTCIYIYPEAYRETITLWWVLDDKTSIDLSIEVISIIIFSTSWTSCCLLTDEMVRSVLNDITIEVETDFSTPVLSELSCYKSSSCLDSIYNSASSECLLVEIEVVHISFESCLLVSCQSSNHNISCNVYCGWIYRTVVTIYFVIKCSCSVVY